jgi:hypothetical protein
MNAISGTRRAIKELVDGTIRVQVDIDPQYRKSFFDLFPTIDAPIALAPLVADFERKTEPEPTEAAHRKLGPLALLAVQWCRDPHFLQWAGWNWPHGDDSRAITQEEARFLILDTCKIGSRRELDTVPSAAHVFHAQFRDPYMAYMEGKQ